MQVSGHIRKRESQAGLAYQIIIELPNDPKTGKRRRIYKTIHGSYTDAEHVMKNMMREWGTDTDWRGKSTKQEIPLEGYFTVKEWMNQWYELYLKDLSPTTLTGYRYQIDNYIIPKFGSLYIQELKPLVIQQWINDLQACSPITGRKMSAKTVRNIFLNLSSALQKAVSLEFMEKNPCANITLPRYEKYKASVYDEEEVQRLVQAIRGTDMELPLMIDLSLGLRRGELIALKWEHIDFEQGLISIQENRVNSYWGVVTKTPKSKSGLRTIPVSGSLLTLLKRGRQDYLARKERYGEFFYDGDYVVCQENGKPFKPCSFSEKFREFLKKNNLRHIRLHDLRHTNATLMLSQGISPKVAQQRLGHSDFSTTMNIYSHVLATVEKEAADKIDSIVFGDVSSL